MKDGDEHTDDVVQEARGNGQWPETLSAIYGTFVNTLKRAGLGSDRAASLASSLTIELATYAGGRMLYLPSGFRIRMFAKHREIFHRHNGKNTQALATEYRVSTRAIQKIVAQQRALLRRSRANA